MSYDLLEAHFIPIQKGMSALQVVTDIFWD